MFFVTLVVCRSPLRPRSALAAIYGRRILIRMLDSDLFHHVVLFFVALAVILTMLSLVQIVRTTRKPATI